MPGGDSRSTVGRCREEQVSARAGTGTGQRGATYMVPAAETDTHLGLVVDDECFECQHEG